ncbi:MAG TPA: glycosyltransferase family 2 protein [Xanthobacteraceae bacterium]|nr:glycosyltransferase family 2 protein [Xanthobacteraceae bacterium]
MTAFPDDIQLLIPSADVADPEITILVPALNEELTIGRFVEWCRQGIAASGARVEILIVDSSTDRTPQIAQAGGARVLQVPKRGLGRAYIDAIPHIRGRFVIMGDADCTYDFREIKPFVEAFRAGNEFVMGSRFKGSIAPGAMPALHRYFGTPVTTFILNMIFGSRFSDIHCGMRGVTRDALARMDMRSQGWEYASEMVLKSVHMGLKTAEVPIHFLKDPEGRLSHMKRRGWLEPWRAGWMNLRAMLVHGVDFFLLKPGAVLLALGLLFLIPLSFGPLTFGPISVSLNTMLLAMAAATLGLSMVYFGGIASILFDYSDAVRPRLERLLPYNTTFVLCLLVTVGGVLATVPLMRTFTANGFVLPTLGIETHWAVLGLWLIIAAFETFIFALMVRALGIALPVRRGGG